AQLDAADQCAGRAERGEHATRHQDRGARTAVSRSLPRAPALSGARGSGGAREPLPERHARRSYAAAADRCPLTQKIAAWITSLIASSSNPAARMIRAGALAYSPISRSHGP